MKQFPIILLLLLCGCPSTVWPQGHIYTTQNLPKVHLQDQRRYACNPDGILSPMTCDSIDRMLYNLEQQTGIETVVAVVGSIGDASCFDFCHQLLNEWGVGKKEKNNGLVVLLVTDQRCIQFYTGYGLEGDLPDAICKRIQTRDMVPYLKEGNWDAGMMAGIRSICARLDGSMENDSEEEEEDDVLIVILLFIGFIGIAVITAIWAARAASKCPHCGRHTLQRSASRLLYQRGGVRKEEITYLCTHCGHLVKREQSSYDDQYHGNRGNGPILFGGGSGMGGGGGFHGGSFGGGIGGGGGAGTRF